ncbi:MAG: methionyl-tRNA formyltransferase [Thermotogota bacterium]|nr:methionyl-tRNA formyltransferase [Thermotogota bacterium]MDK2865004.1 methionyl-tRNA formyltransferase [Thermotogota bacterium]
MRYVFLGTGEFGAGCLKCLVSFFPPTAVFTQPDRPAGRGKKLLPPPVKQAALESGIIVEQHESVNRGKGWEKLLNYKPDLILVADFGQILSTKVLELPKLGCFNVHPSLLPKYRGAAPIQRALQRGEMWTGVTIFKVVKELDAGPIALQEKVPVFLEDNFESLRDRLIVKSCELLKRFFEILQNRGKLELKPQDHSKATYASKLSPDDLYTNWFEEAEVVRNHIRSLDPSPGARSFLNGSIVKLFNAWGLDNVQGVPGRILKITKEGMLVAAGRGSVWIGKIQFPGGKVLTPWEALNGRKIKEGDEFSVHSHT